ncbi:inositol monophosphatase family protein [Pelagibacterium lentulum]|uniref:Inositol monophosphatase n=1 Tax=Pelagibacterium lentulum TaxID=2029865 RepID=A0A916RKJ1_9HYPH|nr:inositol monophosphatase [Pelagibacterium lentulum]GGA59454.1 inositol monophosphatase [Pelagibacterium lentulum]
MPIFRTSLLEAVTALLRTVAQNQILPRCGRLTAADVSRKSADNDLVTAADLAAEVALTRGLRKLAPEALVIGEEAVFANPQLLEAIDRAELAFIVDPIDGTWNFAHGMPLFGSIIAATMNGTTVAAWIHYPQSGETLVAERGAGAFMLGPWGDSSPCRVSKQNVLAHMTGFLALPVFDEDHKTHIASQIPKLGDVTSYFCSAYEYRMLVTGAKDFALNGLMAPWDHAAGQLLHQEAGGYSALCDATIYRPGLTKGPLLLAPSRESWVDLRNMLTPQFNDVSTPGTPSNTKQFWTS